MSSRATRPPLTARQADILRFITTYGATHRTPPTVREIGAHFGIGPSAVFGHLTALTRKGRIRKADRGSRAIDVVPKRGTRVEGGASIAVPILGRIAAGTPIFAEEHIEGHLPVEAPLASGGAPLFALEVRGRSMIGAGILDGDYVIARQQSAADPGDIVVALIGDDATVKRLVRGAEGWRLMPENPEYETVPVTEATMIQGRVVAVYRRLA